MDAIQYNGYWISTDTYLTSAHRDVNAKLIWDYLTELGWTPNCVAGILGNFWVESTMNPALIQGRDYSTLLTNEEALVIPDGLGMGIAQWSGSTHTEPAGRIIPSFAIRYNMQWYDGNLQCFRLQREYEVDLQFDPGTVDGVYYDWQVYTTSTATPDVLAKAWWARYERGGLDLQTRQEKALYYYEMFNTTIPVWLLFAFRKRKEMKRAWRKM